MGDQVRPVNPHLPASTFNVLILMMLLMLLMMLMMLMMMLIHPSTFTGKIAARPQCPVNLIHFCECYPFQWKVSSVNVIHYTREHQISFSYCTLNANKKSF